MLVHKEIEETIPTPTFTGRGLHIGRLANRRRRHHSTWYGGIGEAIDNDGW